MHVPSGGMNQCRYKRPTVDYFQCFPHGAFYGAKGEVAPDLFEHRELYALATTVIFSFLLPR